MPTYGTLEAKNRFSELIERAARGEEVVITRHGKPVVKFGKVVEPAEERQERAKKALDRIKSRSEKIKTGLTADEILEFIREGRR
jgi:prevent-host-death family protein